MVEQLGVGALPDLLDDGAQLLVGLVDVALRLDAQRGPHQREQRRVEHDRAVAVQGHVHRHQPLQHNDCMSRITG